LRDLKQGNTGRPGERGLSGFLTVAILGKVGIPHNLAQRSFARPDLDGGPEGVLQLKDEALIPYRAKKCPQIYRRLSIIRFTLRPELVYYPSRSNTKV
jgi:hypothetical protein